MERKFKIGDKIKVVRLSRCIGITGRVILLWKTAGGCGVNFVISGTEDTMRLYEYKLELLNAREKDYSKIKIYSVVKFLEGLK